MGVADCLDELVFLIKFKRLDEPELVAATVANKSIPQMVIAFYEDHFNCSDSD